MVEWARFLALGVNDQVLVELGKFPGFLNDPYRPIDAVYWDAASASRPARPSRQHPMQQIEGLLKAKKPPFCNQPTTGSGVV